MGGLEFEICTEFLSLFDLTCPAHVLGSETGKIATGYRGVVEDGTQASTLQIYTVNRVEMVDDGA